MAVYVLAGGAWLGGWCWRPVARRLRERGHDVYPVTLTGLGERVHLASRDIDLDTHISDVVNLITYEDLHEVILLGHSYAGIVVTGVSDRIPERLSQLVYLDAGPAPDGVALLDMQSPEARQDTERQVAELGDGWRFPMPSWDWLQNVDGADLTGLGDAQRALMQSHATDQPFRTFTQPLRLTNPARDALSKALITCSFPLAQVREMITAEHPWFRELGGPLWRLLELPTGHWPMFSAPEELATLLGDLSPDAAAGT